MFSQGGCSFYQRGSPCFPKWGVAFATQNPYVFVREVQLYHTESFWVKGMREGGNGGARQHSRLGGSGTEVGGGGGAREHI